MRSAPCSAQGSPSQTARVHSARHPSHHHVALNAVAEESGALGSGQHTASALQVQTATRPCSRGGVGLPCGFAPLWAPAIFLLYLASLLLSLITAPEGTTLR